MGAVPDFRNSSVEVAAMASSPTEATRSAKLSDEAGLNVSGPYPPAALSAKYASTSHNIPTP